MVQSLRRPYPDQVTGLSRSRAKLSAPPYWWCGSPSEATMRRHRGEVKVRAAEIFVVATHQTEILLRWCTRAVWLDEGRIRVDGPAADVLGAYLAAR